MDTRRHYNSQNYSEGVNINRKAFPGLIVLGVGGGLIVVGTILLAALGIPSDISQKPATIVGPIILCIGFVLCVAGGITAYILKKKGVEARKRMRAEQRQREKQEAEQQQAARSQAAPQEYGHGQPGAQPARGALFNTRVAPADQQGEYQDVEYEQGEYDQQAYDQSNQQNANYSQGGRTQYTHQNDFYQPDSS